MKTLQASYFDGKDSRRHAVTVVIGGGRLKVVGRDVAADFDARRVRRSLRIADTPRWLYLPGGGACVTGDNDAVDQLMRPRRYDRILHTWESRPAYAALCVGLVAAAAWLLVDRGLPAIAEQVAERIPVAAETQVGRQTLEGMERFALHASRVPAPRQEALRAGLARMMRAAGDTTAYTVEFRSSRAIGPNAFALPSGIIVITDELVDLASRDEEILGVLAHEVGHVHYRHTMRRLLESSATALLIAGLTGDIASTTSLAAAAPALLLQTRYSRDDERQADAYAIALMRKSGISPKNLAAILARVEESGKGRGGAPTFLSSHPATKERAALANAAARD